MPDDDFQQLVSKGRELVETIPALKINRAECLRVPYQILLNTISVVDGTPANKVSPEQIQHGLHMLSKLYDGPVELDEASCRDAGADPERLTREMRFSMRQRSRADESERFRAAFDFELNEATRANQAAEQKPPSQPRNRPQPQKSSGDSTRAQNRIAKWRCDWLDEHRGNLSDTEIGRREGAPTYNTIQRWKSGQLSNQDTSVRGKLAKALNCKLSDVPK